MAEHMIEGIKHIAIKTFVYISSEGVYEETADKITEETPVSGSDYYRKMHIVREKMFSNLLLAEIN